jgi:hypothetical protein
MQDVVDPDIYIFLVVRLSCSPSTESTLQISTIYLMVPQMQTSILEVLLWNDPHNKNTQIRKFLLTVVRKALQQLLLPLTIIPL